MESQSSTAVTFTVSAGALARIEADHAHVDELLHRPTPEQDAAVIASMREFARGCRVLAESYRAAAAELGAWETVSSAFHAAGSYYQRQAVQHDECADDYEVLTGGVAG